MIHLRVWAWVLLVLAYSCFYSNAVQAGPHDSHVFQYDAPNADIQQWVGQSGGSVDSYSYNSNGACLRDDVRNVFYGSLCSYLSSLGSTYITSYSGYKIIDPTNGASLSNNLIDPNAWNITYGPDPGGCCASITGNQALYDTNTNTIMFSYGRSVLEQTIAINQALAQSGVNVDGYTYKWSYRLIYRNSPNDSSDTLIFDVIVNDANGNQVEQYTYDYSGFADGNWRTASGYQQFTQSYLDPQTIALRITGQDGGFWAGYYGPEVKDVFLNLTYSANPCATNPLYDVSCPGYAAAYAEQLFQQQCTANPLYDSSCPGYAAAYETQQCTINPLYSPSCPGYAQAYLEQQCSINPLYDQSCSGYAQAYFNQQCTVNPLYNVGCPNYSSVNTSPNVVTDPSQQYNTTFQKSYAVAQALQLSGANLTLFGFDFGYEYKVKGNYSDVGGVCVNRTLGICTQWATINPNIDGTFSVIDANGNTLGSAQQYFDIGTNGNWIEFRERLVLPQGSSMQGTSVKFDYVFKGSLVYGDMGMRNLTAEALFVGDPCADNPLYSTMCSGYQEAYTVQQCSIVGPLYDSSCPGYAEAFFNQQCGASALYDASCPGYAQAYYDQQCSLDSLYDTGCPGYAEAYLTQQCNISQLYSTSCPNYTQALFTFNCSLDPLFDKQCTGYEQAYYEKYIKPDLDKQIAEASNTSPSTTTTTSTPAVTTTGTVAPVSTTGDSTVDSVIAQPTTTSPTSVTSVTGTSVLPTATTPASTTTETVSEQVSSEQPSDEQAAEEKAAEEVVASVEAVADDKKTSTDKPATESGSKTSGNTQSAKSDDRKTKEEKVKELLVAKLKELANETGKAATLEQQQALQAQITALINFVPGFNAYGQLAIPGVDFYASDEIYKNAKVPDSKRGARNGLAQQLLWDKMVDMQYNRGDQ